MTRLETDITYTFEISENLTPDYRMAQAISIWLRDNLAGLTDDNGNVIFNKVNTGYNEETLKSLGKKPACDVHISSVDYDTDFTDNKPVTVHTIVLFYFKGANNNAYKKACELHDYMMQEFIENQEWKILPDVVRDTIIVNSELMNQPTNKRWGCMGAFELSHLLY